MGSTVSIENTPKYYELTKRIRNLHELTNEDFEYIKGLPHKNLVELIDIYNMDIKFMNQIFNSSNGIYNKNE